VYVCVCACVCKYTAGVGVCACVCVHSHVYVCAHACVYVRLLQICVCHMRPHGQQKQHTSPHRPVCKQKLTSTYTHTPSDTHTRLHKTHTHKYTTRAHTPALTQKAEQHLNRVDKKDTPGPWFGSPAPCCPCCPCCCCCCCCCCWTALIKDSSIPPCCCCCCPCQTKREGKLT